jgi:hypothetical protein
MNFLIWLSLALSFLLLLLFPFLFSELMIVGLTKLRLEPETAAWIVIAMLLGGLVNIPISRLAPRARGEGARAFARRVWILRLLAGNSTRPPRNHCRRQRRRVPYPDWLGRL